jgi:hypothetical protein
MKKIIIASVLGVAACAAVTSSYGQGSMIFVNYSLGATSYFAPVTVGSLAGPVVGSDFTATLLYSSTLNGTYTAVTGAAPQAFSGTGLGDSADGGGFFSAVGVTVPVSQYTGGAAFFEIFVQNVNSVTFDSNLYTAGQLSGTSASFAYSTLATAANSHPTQDPFPDSQDVTTPLTAFFVTPVPEPTTLALAGLGGLASLVALRRKKA